MLQLDTDVLITIATWLAAVATVSGTAWRFLAPIRRIDDKTNAIDKRLVKIETIVTDELQANSGKSVKDQVTRLEARADAHDDLHKLLNVAILDGRNGVREG